MVVRESESYVTPPDLMVVHPEMAMAKATPTIAKLVDLICLTKQRDKATPLQTVVLGRSFPRNHNSKTDKSWSHVDHVSPVDVHHPCRDSVKQRTQINNLGVLYPIHLTDERYPFWISIGSKTAGFHDRLQHGGRTFEYDFTGSLHFTGHDDGYSDCLQSYDNITVLKLGFVELGQFRLQLTCGLSGGRNIANQR